MRIKDEIIALAIVVLLMSTLVDTAKANPRAMGESYNYLFSGEVNRSREGFQKWTFNYIRESIKQNTIFEMDFTYLFVIDTLLTRNRDPRETLKSLHAAAYDVMQIGYLSPVTYTLLHDDDSYDKSLQAKDDLKDAVSRVAYSTENAVALPHMILRVNISYDENLNFEENIEKTLKNIHPAKLAQLLEDRQITYEETIQDVRTKTAKQLEKEYPFIHKNVPYNMLSGIIFGGAFVEFPDKPDRDNLNGYANITPYITAQFISPNTQYGFTDFDCNKDIKCNGDKFNSVGIPQLAEDTRNGEPFVINKSNAVLPKFDNNPIPTKQIHSFVYEVTESYLRASDHRK